MSNQEHNPEEMSDFFKVRADGYDSHMEENVYEFSTFYERIAAPIKSTSDKINILDLGCGTGIELKEVFNKAPNATVTGIDLSNRMLEILVNKYESFKNQLTLIDDSYITYPFEDNRYDYIVSVMTMHHWQYEQKLTIYQRIKKALKHGGKYIEGDYVVNEEDERQLYHEYLEKMKSGDESKLYHIDIPMTKEKQIHLLTEAGFSKVEIIYSGENNIILVASV